MGRAVHLQALAVTRIRKGALRQPKRQCVVGSDGLEGDGEVLKEERTAAVGS